MFFLRIRYKSLINRTLLDICAENDGIFLNMYSRRGKWRDYPVRVMWNLIIAMKVFGYRTWVTNEYRKEYLQNPWGLGSVALIGGRAAKCHKNAESWRGRATRVAVSLWLPSCEAHCRWRKRNHSQALILPNGVVIVIK